MLPHLVSATILGLTALVSGLGTSCSAPVASGTAAPSDPFWMEQIKHQGTSPFNPNPSGYQVFRNVKVRHAAPPRYTQGSPVDTDCRFPQGLWRQGRWSHRRYGSDQVSTLRRFFFVRVVLMPFAAQQFLPVTGAEMGAASRRRSNLVFLLLVTRSMSDPLVSTLLLCTSLLGESHHTL